MTCPEGGVEGLARIAGEVNQSVETIGARRRYTIMEKVVEELSFHAPDKSGEVMAVDEAFVNDNVGKLAASADLSRYVL